MQTEFQFFPRGGEGCWVHKSKPVWLVLFPSTYIRGEHWKAFAAIEPAKQGRPKWATSNRLIGGPDGFCDFDTAAQAALKAIA